VTNGKASGRPRAAPPGEDLVEHGPTGVPGGEIAPTPFYSVHIDGLRLNTQTNQSKVWQVRHRYVAMVRERVWMALRPRPKFKVPPPWSVSMVRIGPRQIDSDNVVSSLKAVRDQVAQFLGVDDGDVSKVVWHCHQLRGPFGVTISIYHRHGPYELGVLRDPPAAK
jgi:hypothetical protein